LFWKIIWIIFLFNLISSYALTTTNNFSYNTICKQQYNTAFTFQEKWWKKNINSFDEKKNGILLKENRRERMLLNWQKHVCVYFFNSYDLFLFNHKKRWRLIFAKKSIQDDLTRVIINRYTWYDQKWKKYFSKIIYQYVSSERIIDCCCCYAWW